MSARLVAATTMMLSDCAKPSISTSSWLSVCSRSSWLSELPPRLRPTASSSSMKMMQALVAARVAEQLAHARRADAGVHLDEVGAARRDEGHAGFARHRAREQRLAGARRADEQDAARNAAADRSRTAPAPSGSRRSPRTSSFASSTPATSLNVTVTCCGSIGRVPSRASGRGRSSCGTARGRRSRRTAARARARRSWPAFEVSGWLTSSADAALGQAGDEGRVRGDVSLGRDGLQTSFRPCARTAAHRARRSRGSPCRSARRAGTPRMRRRGVGRHDRRAPRSSAANDSRTTSTPGPIQNRRVRGNLPPSTGTP